MSEKNNDILEEQRRARREFLELKKMQNGELETGPKPSEVAIVPKTPKEKLKNIWFHDKWYIIGITALIVVIAVLVTQCATRTKYDLEIVLFSYNAIMDDAITDMADYFEQYCEDINGDGQVNIQIINCSYSKDDTQTQYQYTMSTKLQAIIAADSNALLFITDADSYEYLNNISKDETFFEKEPVILGEKFYDSCKGSDVFKLPDGLQISCRKIGTSVVSKDKKIKEYYKQSQNILSGIINKE